MSTPVTVGQQWTTFDAELRKLGICDAHVISVKVGFISGYRIALRHAVREFNLSIRETDGQVLQAQERLNALMDELDMLDAELRFG